jgi:hypothetical protein
MCIDCHTEHNLCKRSIEANSVNRPYLLPKVPKHDNVVLYRDGYLWGLLFFKTPRTPQKSPAHRCGMDFNEYLARVRQAEAAQQALSKKAASLPASSLAAVLPADDDSKEISLGTVASLQVHAAQCATIRAAAAGRGQGRSTLKIDSEAFDRAKRVLRSPIKKRSVGSEAASLPRCPTSRQKPAHRFAGSGYIFELGFVFANNPSVLGF